MEKETNRVRAVIKFVEEKKLTAGYGIEIGVYEGKITLGLLKTYPDLQMTAVDQWVPVYGIGDKNTTGHTDFVKSGIEQKGVAFMVAAMKYRGRLQVLKTDSLSASECFKDGCFDFIFIDADHRRSYVRCDIAVWTPKLRNGGWLIGHDICRREVRQSIDQMIPGWEDIGGDCWTVQKRKLTSAPEEIV